MFSRCFMSFLIQKPTPNKNLANHQIQIRVNKFTAKIKKRFDRRFGRKNHKDELLNPFGHEILDHQATTGKIKILFRPHFNVCVGDLYSQTG